MTADKRQISITYESWSKSGSYQERTFESINTPELDDLVLSMGNEHSAILILETEAYIFDIAVGEGLMIYH